MNEIEKMRLDVERKYQEMEKELEDAQNVKELAAQREKAAKAAMKELESARKVAEKAEESYRIYRESCGLEEETPVVEEKPCEEEVCEEEATYEEEPTYVVKEEHHDGFVNGLVMGLTVAALVATGAWVVVRHSKTGDVNTAMLSNDELAEDENAVIVDGQEEGIRYAYDYEGNVVTIIPTTMDPNATYSYDFEANSAEPIEGAQGEVYTSAGQPVVAPVINAELPANTQYVELTTERFEELCTNLIQKYEGLGMDVSREDIIKYVMIRNLDKLRQDNNELVESIIGTQEPLEVFADADHVIDAVMTYNLLYFDKYHNTDGFLSAADGVFDDVQRERVLEIERRVYEIGAYYQDEATYNELTYSLLRDMINPLNPISELEDGVSYGVEWIDMYMVRSTFGTDRYIRLNDVNSDLVKYFVSFAGDGEEYENNALVNGNVRNINALLTQCDTYTLTK